LRSETTSEFRIGRTKQNNIETSFEDMKKFRKRERERGESGLCVCINSEGGGGGGGWPGSNCCVKGVGTKPKS